jgi:hypothetical protein
MTSKTKIPVTTRAVVQRINRKLKLDSEMLKAARGQMRQEVGDYHVIDWNKKYVTHTRVNLEKMARDLDVLKPWEEVKEDA